MFRDLAILISGVAISFVSIVVLEFIVESYINPDSLHYGTIVEIYEKSSDSASVQILEKAEKLYKREIFFQSWVYIPITALIVGTFVSTLADVRSCYQSDREGMLATIKYFLIAAICITPLSLASLMTSSATFLNMVMPLISGCVAATVLRMRIWNY